MTDLNSCHKDKKELIRDNIQRHTIKVYKKAKGTLCYRYVC